MTLHLRRYFLTFRSWLDCQEAWLKYSMLNQQPIELVAVDFVVLMLPRKIPLLQGQEGGGLCQPLRIRIKPLNKVNRGKENQYYYYFFSFKKAEFRRRRKKTYWLNFRLALCRDSTAQMDVIGF